MLVVRLLSVIWELSHIDRQLSYVLTYFSLFFSETYPPKVLIKTRIDKAILSKNYFLQCNSRGNPLPRLFWSKKNDKNDTFEYYPISKQCRTSCRIYSIQHKYVDIVSLIIQSLYLIVYLRYQSFLYFQSLKFDDIGIYYCRKFVFFSKFYTLIFII